MSNSLSKTDDLIKIINSLSKPDDFIKMINSLGKTDDVIKTDNKTIDFIRNDQFSE